MFYQFIQMKVGQKESKWLRALMELQNYVLNKVEIIIYILV